MKIKKSSKLALGFVAVMVVLCLAGVIRRAQPHQDVTEVDVRLTNMYGVTLDEKFVDGRWVLGEEEEVLVWMDLPTDIDQLDGRIESTFPYKVAAGETGTIDIKLTSEENDMVYVGKLDFVASDDLTLETGVNHKPHGNSGEIEFWNSESYEMKCLVDILEPGKKTYMHYSLYTSSQNNPIIFSGGYSSVGYRMSYDVRPIGDFDEMSYESKHGGTYNGKLIDNWLPLEPSPSELAEMNSNL